MDRRKGLRSLHYATLMANVSLTKVLLDSGVDVNCCDLRGNTPLHLLPDSFCFRDAGSDSEEGRAKEWAVARVLIAAGAEVNATNKNGDTPLDCAQYWLFQTALADLLRRHGAKTGEELRAERQGGSAE